MDPRDPMVAYTAKNPWPDLSPCMTCGQPVEGNEKGFWVVLWRNPETNESGVLGPCDCRECWKQAMSLVEQNRPHELAAFDHYQRLIAEQHGEPYDPQELRYWPPLEQL
jgi:hypothetical protein